MRQFIGFDFETLPLRTAGHDRIPNHQRDPRVPLPVQSGGGVESEDAGVRVQEVSGGARGPRVKPFGCVYAPPPHRSYAHAYWWFEGAETTRKLFMNGIIIFFPDAVVQLVATLLVCFFFTTVLTSARPYKSPSDNLVRYRNQFARGALGATLVWYGMRSPTCTHSDLI